MAYIPYGQATVGGTQLAETLAKIQSAAANLQMLADWVNQIGPANLESNTDFTVGAGSGQAFNDTFLQIAADFATWYGNGTGGTNREKIARLARGS